MQIAECYNPLVLGLSNKEIASCLDELEGEFLRVGASDCNCLQLRSQLSAFLLLGLRAVSLLRGMEQLLSNQMLDSYDPVRRAFFESWLLQFEFRIVASGTKAAKWFESRDKSWSPDIAKLSEFVKSLKLPDPTFGRDYGELTEVAHPTFQAAENSCCAALARWNEKNDQGHASREEIQNNTKRLLRDFEALLVREIWLVDAQDIRLIDIHVNVNSLARCEKIFSDWQKILGSQEQ